MAVETEDDRSFLLKDFGMEVILPNSTAIVGIFDSHWQSYGDDLHLSGANPVLLCRASDVSGVVEGEVIEIANVEYVIRDTQPDGTGFTKLELARNE